MRSLLVRGAVAAGCLAGAGRLLGWLAPDPGVIATTLRHPQHAALGSGMDAVALAAAGAACWLALLWLAVALAVSAGAALPGRAGQVADVVATVAVPATARRLVAVALGLSVVTAVGAAPAMASAPPAPQSTSSRLDLDWPVAAEPPAPPAAPVTRRPAVLDQPDRSASPAAVVVLRGDSLWRIARRHLPAGATNADVAMAWPRWFSPNRAVIGPDPDLLLPGQRLTPPADSPGGQP